MRSTPCPIRLSRLCSVRLPRGVVASANLVRVGVGGRAWGLELGVGLVFGLGLGSGLGAGLGLE